MPRLSGKVERTCEQCGKHFFTIPFFIKRGQGRFCSVQCYAKARSTKIEVTCVVCGKDFKTYPCRIKLGYGKFCSKRCFNKSLEGKPLLAATCKATEVNRGRPRSPEAVAKTVAGNKGKHRTNEQRQLLSSLAKRRVGQKNPFYHKQHSPETRKELSKAQKLNWEDPKYRQHQVESGRQRWQNAEFVNKMMIAFQKKPTKPEKYLDDIMRKHFPQYRYNGDGRLGIMIGGQIPDFPNVNGKKDLIEVFGDYYHSPQVLGDRWQGSELGKIMIYNSLGWRCLVIWEHELKQLAEDEIVLKIKNFHGRKYARTTNP